MDTNIIERSFETQSEHSDGNERSAEDAVALVMLESGAVGPEKIMIHHAGLMKVVNYPNS